MMVFGLIPILDMTVGDDGQNPPEDVYEELSSDRYYRWCTYLFLPLLFGGLIAAGWMWSSASGLSTWDKIGLACTVGLINGIGINAAHELGHRAERHERLLAKIALAPTCYGHFFIEHNHGHHVRVATPEDPASSRFGESLWRFLPRTVAGSFTSAVHLERRRLHRRGHRFLSPQNHLLQAWGMTVALLGSMVLIFGYTIVPFIALQALIAIFLLESVNYVEHYGLLRKKRPNGRYERCAPHHSWNSDRLVTNVFLYHLQRHSDHHANPHRRYQTLRSSDTAPQLPAGYATMLLLAMIPPLWRYVMDPKVAAHYNGDLTQANLAPGVKI